MHNTITIRFATKEDTLDLLAIYTPYVKDTAITFEYDVPSQDEFKSRIKTTLKKYPYIVALYQDEIVGYAYASAFKSRAAYDWSVETSIYVKTNAHGKGIGKKLYYTLENLLKAQHVTNINACIAYTSIPDSYLTNTSSLFHEHLGYKQTAYFTKCAFKFNTWYDMIWMEKTIAPHEVPPLPFIPISDLPPTIISEILTAN